MPVTIRDEAVKTLQDMLATFTERNISYGENYLMLGAVMEAFFPAGIRLETQEDFIRYDMFNWIVSKLTRFVSTGMLHEDSIKDAAVYSAMLTAFVKRHYGETR